MAHGFSANKLMSLSAYAEEFVTRGYACLIFDYRRWGASDGTPRHILLVNEQLEDYRTVIEYARGQPEFDGQRVVLWGSSFSGGHAITLTADRSVAPFAAIAQGPYTGGRSPIIKYNLGFVKTVILLLADVLKQSLGMEPVYIPAAANPGEVGALTAEGAMTGLVSIAPEAQDYPNEVNASSFLQIPFYQPVATASSIECPIILIAAELDNLCALDNAISVVDAAPHAEFVKLHGGGHFDVYPGKPHYKTCLGAQLMFLEKHVPI